MPNDEQRNWKQEYKELKKRYDSLAKAVEKQQARYFELEKENAE